MTIERRFFFKGRGASHSSEAKCLSSIKEGEVSQLLEKDNRDRVCVDTGQPRDEIGRNDMQVSNI